MRNFRLVLISAVTIALLIAATFGVYFLYNKKTVNVIANDAGSSSNVQQTQPKSAPRGGENPFLFGMDQGGGATTRAAGESEAVHAFDILLRLFLAVVLSAVLAFRPRKNVPLFGRNLYVAQTQILLAVVAAALMLIVGDNTARAFAIFAAVSLVRFRTNIKDPKEITVLLISLALGLATGVGRWDLGAILCGFALVLLWFLEFNEPEKVTRSMELTVKTRNADLTNQRLKMIFKRFRLEGEIRQIDPPDEANPVGCIMYYLNLPLSLSTDYLNERVFELDAENIDGIQWEQKKGSAYIYQ
jgi:uncharacterized membrane protein YhiD involved in acid resistance